MRVWGVKIKQIIAILTFPYEAIPLLIEFLQKTNNHQLRNEIALCLSDIGDDEVVKPLIDIINHPKRLGSRGTLLYALQPFDCSQHLDFLLNLLITGNFEVQAEAFQLIEAIRGKSQRKRYPKVSTE
ncbi:HEAT repeat domain-containing protein [Paenibacillus apiarius]|uniref:HEAT repeat domain-containing protein n=1 Tax=Paenibacillus apiarius TaxID=46240 RepID=UPI0019823EEC|nr:HEAT repeat domain-containing protein [Paenibacillus apiarius]MBN3527245.1 hypothetical protein [Paenibacillus apiarius]